MWPMLILTHWAGISTILVLPISFSNLRSHHVPYRSSSPMLSSSQPPVLFQRSRKDLNLRWSLKITVSLKPTALYQTLPRLHGYAGRKIRTSAVSYVLGFEPSPFNRSGIPAWFNDADGRIRTDDVSLFWFLRPVPSTSWVHLLIILVRGVRFELTTFPCRRS